MATAVDLTGITKPMDALDALCAHEPGDTVPKAAVEAQVVVLAAAVEALQMALAEA